jgi:hypothetical protein
MKIFPCRLTLVACAFSVVASLASAKPLSDLVSPEKRRTTVELAQRLTRPPEPLPLPADLAQPFNPVGFDQPDPEEAKAVALALQKAGGGPASGGGGVASPNQPARAPGDREILENLAAKLPTSGTIEFGGERLLLLGRGRVRVGDKFTVAYNSQDYELELVAIDRTTFTLRYHGEEIVRPTKSGK